MPRYCTIQYNLHHYGLSMNHPSFQDDTIVTAQPVHSDNPEYPPEHFFPYAFITVACDDVVIRPLNLEKLHDPDLQQRLETGADVTDDELIRVYKLSDRTYFED